MDLGIEFVRCVRNQEDSLGLVKASDLQAGDEISVAIRKLVDGAQATKSEVLLLIDRAERLAGPK